MALKNTPFSADELISDFAQNLKNGYFTPFLQMASSWNTPKRAENRASTIRKIYI
jgi:hypothetical protein